MIDRILNYQKIDGQIRQIKKELNDSENKKKGRQLKNYLHECESNLIKMDERTNELNILLGKMNVTYDQKNELIAEYDKSVKTCKDLQEIDYLSKKVVELQKAVLGMEKDINALIQEIDVIAKQYDIIKGKYPHAMQQYKECKQAYEEEQKKRQPEIEVLEEQLKQAEKGIKPEIIEKYNKLKDQNVYPPFVMLVGSNQCGGCQMEIPSGIVGGMQEKGYIICENCHRIVFKQN